MPETRPLRLQIRSRPIESRAVWVVAEYLVAAEYSGQANPQASHFQSFLTTLDIEGISDKVTFWLG